MVKSIDKDANIENPGSSDKENLTVPAGRPYLPHLPSDPPCSLQPRTLPEFREQEGRANREHRLHEIWKSLPDVLHEPHNRSKVHRDPGQLTPEKAEGLQKMYDRELLSLCSTHPSAGQAPHVGWKKFKEFAEKKEAGKSLSLQRFQSYFDP
jgi:solute carrier family 25 phosphate transporter 23/24/25/41